MFKEVHNKRMVVLIDHFDDMITSSIVYSNQLPANLSDVLFYLSGFVGGFQNGDTKIYTYITICTGIQYTFAYR
jgi:hypothetical protein